MKTIQLIKILLLVIWGYGNTYGQIIDRTYEIPGALDAPNVSGCNLVADGSFIVAGFETNARGFLLKVDSIGDLVWRKMFVNKHLIGDPEPTNDGGFIAQTRAYSSSSMGLVGDFFLTKFDSLGNIEYEIVDSLQGVYKNISTSIYYEKNNKVHLSYIYDELDVNSNLVLSNKVHQYTTSSGGMIGSLIDTLAVTYPTGGSYGNTFNRATNYLSWYFKDSKVLLNDGRIASIVNFERWLGSGGTTPVYNMAFCVVDSFGQIETFKYQNYIPIVGDAITYGIAETADGGFVMVGENTQGNFLLKLDSDGDPIWMKPIASHVGLPPRLGVLDNGNIVCGQNVYDYQGNYLNPLRLNVAQRGMHVGSKAVYLAKSNGVDSIRIFIDGTLGKIYLDTIAGNIYRDLNLDCSKNGLEEGMKGIKVQAIGNLNFIAMTDSLGNYSMLVDSGTYTVSAVLPSLYWGSCPPSMTVSTNALHTTNVVNFGLQTLFECPIMTVDIGAPFIRATGGGSAYTISYCNNGTVDAINGTVEVELDPNLNVLSTTIPIASQVGNTYTFNIGNVAMNDCGSFRMQVVIDSSVAISLPISQTFCTQAHIYPDSICIPNYWNGPIIEVDATCLVDTVEFLLENVGAPMIQSLQYYVYEDNVMFRTGNTTVLGNGGTELILEPALLGKTYRIDVKQAPGFPPLLGDSMATIAIEGCNPLPNGTFNTGFITQFSNDNGGVFVAQDCQMGIAAYDPNDKAAQPEGYGSANHIYDYTKLDYRIRFQNTGNDTAFVVVVRDTISPFLDPATIQMGASSHPYTWNLSGQGVLEVTFNNIMLPDSNINEPASHGFFHYEIEQTTNNPIGSIINNTAAIYFDFNPPIFTNTTTHTVGENFVTINLSIGEIYEETVAIKVFPNPFSSVTTIQVEGEEYECLKLRVFDVTGRLVTTTQVHFDNKIELLKGNIQTGVYFYQLEGDGKLINTGKIIAQ